MMPFPGYLFSLFLIYALLISQLCRGQKPSFGIKAGLVFSNATIKNAASSGDFRTISRTGLTGGIYVSLPFGENLVFRPGLEIVTKGVRDGSYPVPFTYLDIPINFLYKKNFPKGHLLAGGGPYIGVGTKHYYTTYPYKSDFGLNALLGYETALGFSFNLNYSHGLSNASSDTERFSKITNRYFGITLGYLF